MSYFGSKQTPAEFLGTDKEYVTHKTKKKTTINKYDKLERKNIKLQKKHMELQASYKELHEKYDKLSNAHLAIFKILAKLV